MSHYRLKPTQTQKSILRQHCAHARYIWNLALEQQSWWRPGRGSAPGYCAQAAQLTEARAELDWLAEGSQMVQQQALRDFAQAMANYYAGSHGKPTWRKESRHDGFRIVAVKPGHIRRLSRKIGAVWIPKADGSVSAGPGPSRRPSPTGSPATGPDAGTSPSPPYPSLSLPLAPAISSASTVA